MASLALSSKAQLAMIRLLMKIGLITSETPSNGFLESNLCPILYFANRGAFREVDAITQVANELGIKFISLNLGQIESGLTLLDRLPFSGVSLARWREARSLPYLCDKEKVYVLMANPLDHELRSGLEFELGLKIEVAIGFEKQIMETLAKKAGIGAAQAISLMLENEALPANDGPKIDNENNDSLRLINSASVDSDDPSAPPVVRVVNKIFSDVVSIAASDLHLVPERDRLLVKVRVDGVLKELFEVPSALKGAVTSRIKLLAGMDIAEKRLPQDGRIRIKTIEGRRDLRVSSMLTANGENIVARILNPELESVSFQSCGMPEPLEIRFKQALLGASRVILVAGPTGSGKTSTLYASLLHLRDGTQNIMTVEDPIEYKISGISQIQVNSKIGMTFAEGLRSILRQDPDIIMVGEIRDNETAQIAMQAAQTGHLVLSTIHTNSAASVITRLMDLKMPDYLICSSLGGILAQRLVRRICSECRGQSGNCTKCDRTGYQGRIGIFSFLEITDKIREAIRSGKGESEIESLARPQGFQTLEEAGLELVNAGITTIDELERSLGRIRSVAASPASSPSVGLEKPRILLVEDDENTRLVLSMVLEREFYEVVQAVNGRDALEKIYAHKPQIILSDLMMPEMTGVDLLQKLKSDPRTQSIPFILLTAASSEENEIKILELGADDFVSKTASSQVMLRRLRKLLGRAQL